MGYYDTVRRYIANCNGNPDELVNLDDALMTSPKTPLEETRIVKMGEVFNETVFKDCIISNIYQQHQITQADLKFSTWLKILEFLDQDFQNGSVTLQIYLQVFLHFSKISIKEDILDKSKYYNELLKIFVTPTVKPLSIHTTITEMSGDDASSLKQRLCSKPVIQAILQNITSLKTSDTMPTVNIEVIVRIITSGTIYQVLFFEPFQPLRGACLKDGILICLNNIAGITNTPNYFADLLTLAIHEFSHHIARILFNDFNFSSPWTLRTTNEARFDFRRSQPLETGRNTELILFDGIQPDWFISLEEAASTFLERIDSNVCSLPIIMMKDHDRLGLVERKPSSFFGIDIKSEYNLMC